MAASNIKFYLAPNVSFEMPVTFTEDLNGDGDGHVVLMAGFSQFHPLHGRPVIISSVDPDPQGRHKDISDKLRVAFGNGPLSWTMAFQRAKSYDEVHKHTEFRLMLKSDVDIVATLKGLCGNVYFQAELGYIDYGYMKGGSFTTKEMTVMCPKDSKTVWCVYESYNPVIDSIFRADDYVYNTKTLTGKMNLIIRFEKQLAAYPTAEVNPDMVMNKRILDEELASDVVIVCENGAEVKCHRNFLAAQTDVFQDMFETDNNMQNVEMEDMGEEVVQALLAYLYHWDVSKAEEKCAVALELLKLGHKYSIHYLKKAMQKLLLAMGESWYEIEVAIKLFLFVHDFDTEWDALKEKAVTVLKNNSHDLENSPTFEQLFTENPKTAMKLCRYGIAM